MHSIVFNSTVPYTARVGSGAIELLAPASAELVKGKTCAVVTDDGVPSAIIKKAAALLEQAGFRSPIFEVRAGESHKNLAGMNGIYSFLYEKGLTRADAVIAVGGGVVGDMAGFAAATYLRGLQFINVPTTFIAQTDSAYGGKTGVDFSEGKNHVGCFYDPAAVICDTDFLSTLPERERISGMGEVIKYGAIASRDILAAVAAKGSALPDQNVIAACVKIKRGFVEGDEHDKGKRHALNFGHTVGHAIEADSGYSIPHGQAVAYGMLAAARIGVTLGVTTPSAYGDIEKAALACGLETDWQSLAASAVHLLARDKKSDGSAIDLVLIKDIGVPARLRMTAEEIAGVIGKQTANL